MTYPILASIFISTCLTSLILLLAFTFRFPFVRRHRNRILKSFAGWIVFYCICILIFTGPENLKMYPPGDSSPYKLPWQLGVSHFVAQGNRSFTSHRDFHQYAWDFVMLNGTEVLAARSGRVSEVEDYHKGIGFHSNFITVEHEDGQKSAYAHIRYAGSLVKVGDQVRQGQPIALSGMVGQTIFPHLHFYVINKEGTSSIPISFQDVPEGVPFAGRFYTSSNGHWINIEL